jgi:heme exporter protein D
VPKHGRSVFGASNVGHRGAFLLFLGLLDFCYGGSLAYVWLHPGLRNFVAGLWPPVGVWAIAWMVTGLTCVLGAFAVRDRIAFALAAALKIAWAGVSAYSWIDQHLLLGWVAVVIWLSFGITVLIISGWPDPVKLAPHPLEKIADELRKEADG